MRSLFGRKPAFLPTVKLPEQVLLVIDWDNLRICLERRFGSFNMRLDDKLQKLMHWIKTEIGPLWSGKGFVFAPENLVQAYQVLFAKNNLQLIICPKRERPVGDQPKDTVDETIMWFGREHLDHPRVQFICLVSGDEDYLPLLQDAKKHNVRIALVPPTVASLTTQGGLIRFVDNHPITHKRMFVLLDTL